MTVNSKLRFSVWEQAILADVVNAGEDNAATPAVVVVTDNAAGVVRLWSLVRQEFPLQKVFLSLDEFRDVVFCDCVADRRQLPASVRRVLVHNRSVKWSRLVRPASAVVSEEPR